MDTGTIDANHRSAKAQVEIVKELGYAGLAYWEGNPKRGTDGLGEILEELDRNGLEIFPLYYGVWLDTDKPAYEAGLKEAIELLKGRDAMIWLHIMSNKYKKSSPEGDGRAVEIVREVTDMAEEAGLRVVLYPHVNEWLERTEDALRVVKKVNRENVGLSFNLFHRLRVDGEENMDELMESVMPYLFTVTINGSSLRGSIETLDKGEFDTYIFLKKLKELGYTGPIGLQGWGIGGDVYDNLSRSMNAWQKFSVRVALERK
jgi:sugar phosphate isomerase/epimerase